MNTWIPWVIFGSLGVMGMLATIVNDRQVARNKKKAMTLEELKKYF